MSPNSHIKNLCDESLNDLFSKENWEQIIFIFIYKYCLNNFLKNFCFLLIVS